MHKQEALPILILFFSWRIIMLLVPSLVLYKLYITFIVYNEMHGIKYLSLNYNSLILYFSQIYLNEFGFLIIVLYLTINVKITNCRELSY